MAINPAAYPTLGTLKNTTLYDGEVGITDTIANLIKSGVMSPNSTWDGSNTYAGALINDNSYTGVYSVLTWQDDLHHANIQSYKAPGSQINLRWGMTWQSGEEHGADGTVLRWTGLSEQNAEAYRKAYNEWFTTYYASINDEYSSSINTYEYNHLKSGLITKLNMNKIVLYPIFRIRTIEYKKVSEEYNLYDYSTISTKDYSWADIKPEDDTPEGADHDAELWNNGYKFGKSSSGNTTLTYCVGVRLNIYYGDSDWEYDSESGTYINGTTKDRINLSRQDYSAYPYLGSSHLGWGTLYALQELYIPELGSVVYTALPGICFNAFPDNNGFDRAGQTNLASDNMIFKERAFDPVFVNWGGGALSARQEKIDYDEKQDPTAIVRDLQVISINDDINTTIDLTNAAEYSSFYSRLSNDGMYITSYSGYHNQVHWTFPTLYSIKKLWGTIANLGVCVAQDEITAAKAQTGKGADSPLLYCGEMLEDGTTTGIMIQGIEIQKLPQGDMTDFTDSPYVPVDPIPDTPDPDPDPDENVPDEHTGGTKPHGAYNVGGIQGFITMYALSNPEVQLFGMGLWDSISTGEILANFFKLGNDDMTFSYGDILEYIVSLKFFPFDLNNVGVTILNGRGDTGIRMGTGKVLVPVNSTVRPIVYSSTCELDGGYCTIPAKQSSYLDCEPVAVATLYIPFCGTTDITLSAVTDYQLHLRYFVDLITGCCTAIVEMSTSNGYQPIAELQGVIGFDILITGTNKNHQLSSVLSSLRHSALAVGGSIGSAVVGGVTGNPAMLIGGIAGAAGTIADQAIDMPKTAELHPMSAGSASSLNALCSYHTAWIQIKRHNPEINNSFGRSIGYLANKSVTIGSCSGFTQVTNPNLSGIPATADELAIIKDILTSGFYA